MGGSPAQSAFPKTKSNKLPHPKGRGIRKASTVGPDIPVPLHTGTDGKHYLDVLQNALGRLDKDYRMAFVIAGTDVLVMDRLGGFQLTIDECVARDVMIANKLRDLSIPMVFTGGGGYSKDSAPAISRSIKELYKY